MCAERPNEIEVTPEMIEAGVRTLYGSGSIENPVYANDRSLVEQIFRSMREARHACRSLERRCPS